MLRAFIAITPPSTLQQSMAEVRQVFQHLSLPWRWVTPDHIHLTLRFLGNVPEESVPSLLQAMEQDSGQKSKELRVDGGAAADNLLMQYQADLLGIPVVRPKVLETTALGAAYLAGLATGVWKSREEIARQWKIAKRF